MQLKYDVERSGRSATVIVAGDIDMASVQEFRDLLNDLIVEGHVDLVLDLNGVGFIDSSGLGALIGTRRKAHTFRGSLTLVCDDNQVLRVLELTNLDRVFRIVPSRPGPHLGDA